MGLDELEAAWNASADRYNQWSELGIDEIVEFAQEVEREVCAEKAGEFAKKWWSIHCASNKHMATTRKAHDDFCALQVAIRVRPNAEITGG